ncbi:hypothetical protein CR513_29312, partial [Mucuna pruriens]
MMKGGFGIKNLGISILPKISWKTHLCDACQKGKQIKSTGVYFLSHKNKSYEVFEIFYKRVQNEKGIYISTIRSDHVITSLRSHNNTFDINDTNIKHNKEVILDQSKFLIIDMEGSYFKQLALRQ